MYETCLSLVHGLNLSLLSENGIARNPHMYGDLLLTPEQEKQLSVGDESVIQGIKQGVKLWPNGIVPYELDFRLSKKLILYCCHACN